MLYIPQTPKRRRKQSCRPPHFIGNDEDKIENLDDSGSDQDKCLVGQQDEQQ